MDKSATFPFLQSTRWEKTAIFSRSMLAPLRNQIFVSCLEQCLQSITSAVLTRHQQLPHVGLCSHSAAVFPIKQVCRICLRCGQGGCPAMIWAALSTAQAAHSLTVTTVSVCCWLHSNPPPWNYQCWRWLSSTSAQHALLSIALQTVATSQTFASLFHHEANTGTMTGAFVTLKVVNLTVEQFHSANLVF